MNWIWIILLLCCCCKGNNNDSCIQPRREERCEHRRERDYPRPPFAPECERERERDCGCRASEMEPDSCEE